MRVLLDNLTIVTITFNNREELTDTLNSCSVLREAGCHQIVQNGGDLLRLENYANLTLYEEPDDGIFDALQKGMNKVKTKYFVNIHSGDEFIGKVEDLQQILSDMEEQKLELSLNDQEIPFGKVTDSRVHSSQTWRPFMLHFGVQPPHMPTIFRVDFARTVSYRPNELVIGDFFQYVDMFKKQPKWKAHGRLLVKMAPGGNTTRGIKSYFYVTRQFIGSYGILRGLLIAVFRIPFKFLQMIRVG